MQTAAQLNTDIRPQENPYVGDLAGRLYQRMRNPDISLDEHGWELITEMLNYAAQAEQDLADQRRRILQLESLSTTDELTGLANRRGLQLHFDREVAACRRHGENGILAYLDMDGLKAINDRHGHEVGDAAVKHVARIIKRNIRSTDIAARLGGDEFVILLSRANAVGGRGRVRSIQELVSTTPLVLNGRPLGLGISVGSTAFSGQATLDKVLHLADMAMYQNKSMRKSF